MASGKGKRKRLIVGGLFFACIVLFLSGPFLLVALAFKCPEYSLPSLWSIPPRIQNTVYRPILAYLSTDNLYKKLFLEYVNIMCTTNPAKCIEG